MTNSQSNLIKPQVPPTLWLIDDDPSLRLILEDNFNNAGIEVISFSNAHGAWSRLTQWQAAQDNTTSNESVSSFSEQLPDAILTDIRMPMMDGLSFSDWLNKEFPSIPVIIMTAHSDLKSAIDSYQSGAFEYLPKPFDLDEATAVVNKAFQKNPSASNQALHDKAEANLTTVKSESEDANIISTDNHLLASSSHNKAKSRNKRDIKNKNKEKTRSNPPQLKDTGQIEHNNNPDGIIGQSVAMQNVFRAIGKLASSPITVLITGESGTGKELVANALHRTSTRQANPFIALNMSAIPHELIESELFGHEKGAFTGATSARKGHFELADGGTLFLDEIGDMPYNTQTRLLRVLANGEFFRVGGKTPIKVDVRIISATHQNLEQLVKQGKFREDLFYRLNVIRLPLPALRERADDIPALTEHFLQQTANELNTSVKSLDPSAMQIMQDYSWSGNVRQLENACRWITVMASGDRVLQEDLPPELLSFMNSPITRATNNHNSSDDDAINNQNKTAMNHASTHIEELKAKDSHPLLEPSEWTKLLESWAKLELKQGQSKLLKNALPDFERVMLDVALTHCKGHRGKAADILGWGRNTLTRKIQQVGLDEKW